MMANEPLSALHADHDRDRDARLRLAIEEAGLATWDSDLVTGESMWSANHFRLFGYPVDPSGRATLEMWSSRLHPDDRERVSAEIGRARRKRTLFRCEYRIIRADSGEIVWIEPHGRFLYDSAGRATRLLGVCFDTTARKQAEEQLIRRETQLDLATRIVGIGVFDHDHVEDRLYWSDQFRKIHDMPPQVTPNVALLDLATHPDDRAALLAAVTAAHDPLGDGKFSSEYRIRLHDGEVRWLVGSAQTFFDGEGADRRPIRTVGAELDVTDRKRIETDLRAERESLRLALEASSAGAFDWDAATGRMNWTDGHYRIYGLEPGAAAASYETWLAHVHSDDAERVERAVHDALESHGRYRVEFRIRRTSDGEERWIESQGLAFYEAARPLRMVGVVADVTARRLAEARLRESEARLREADQRKDQFLATLAHELRNPLAPIRTASEMLTLPELTDDQSTWARQVIHRQVEHMARLLDDLLDVARITRGKLQLRPQPVDLGTIVDTAVEAARPLIASRKHGLTIELPPELPPLHGDPVRLAQVLSNLLTNAAKYTDPPGRIALTARVEGQQLRISVTDNGIGLSPSVLAHIFEMFSQVEDAHGRAEGGLGIGLALVKGLVDLHGGTVEAFSEGPGTGSEFVVMLPFPAPGSIPSDESAASSETQAAAIGRKILVADDNQDAANTLAMLLRLAGHEVCTAHNGQAALALASTFRPDVALLDIGMPDTNGYEVARALRRAPWGKGVSLVALTGWGQDEDKRRAHDAGFDHHLTKPVNPQRLGALLRNAASNRSE